MTHLFLPLSSALLWLCPLLQNQRCYFRGRYFNSMSYFLNVTKDEKRICIWQWTSAMLVSPASMSPSSANSTLILHWDTTTPLLKVTRFVRVIPPSCRAQTQDSGLAWGDSSVLQHNLGSISPGTWLKIWQGGISFC